MENCPLHLSVINFTHSAIRDSVGDSSYFSFLSQSRIYCLYFLFISKWIFIVWGKKPHYFSTVLIMLWNEKIFAFVAFEPVYRLNFLNVLLIILTQIILEQDKESFFFSKWKIINRVFFLPSPVLQIWVPCYLTGQGKTSLRLKLMMFFLLLRVQDAQNKSQMSQAPRGTTVDLSTTPVLRTSRFWETTRPPSHSVVQLNRSFWYFQPLLKLYLSSRGLV